MRARYGGFLRNVIVAIGNTGGAESMAPLSRALDHREPLARGHAAWALARVGKRIRDERARLRSRSQAGSRKRRLGARGNRTRPRRIRAALASRPGVGGVRSLSENILQTSPELKSQSRSCISRNNF